MWKLFSIIGGYSAVTIFVAFGNEPAQAVNQTRTGGTVAIKLGSQSIDDFSVIKCKKRSYMSSVKATGEYQGKRIRLTLNAMQPSRPGISVPDGVSTIDMDGEIWQRHEGKVVATEDGKTFTASGTLKGTRLEKQQDGTAKLVPLEGNNIQPFSIEVTCP